MKTSSSETCSPENWERKHVEKKRKGNKRIRED
jgi:hypothetical protein